MSQCQRMHMHAFTLAHVLMQKRSRLNTQILKSHSFVCFIPDGCSNRSSLLGLCCRFDRCNCCQHGSICNFARMQSCWNWRRRSRWRAAWESRFWHLFLQASFNIPWISSHTPLFLRWDVEEEENKRRTRMRRTRMRRMGNEQMCVCEHVWVCDYCREPTCGDVCLCAELGDTEIDFAVVIIPSFEYFGASKSANPFICCSGSCMEGGRRDLGELPPTAQSSSASKKPACALRPANSLTDALFDMTVGAFIES